jgi:osmotically-inducible protein OsmY
MRLLTLLAVAAVGAGVYQYRRRLAQRGRDRQASSDELLASNARSAIAGKASSPVDVRCINGVVSLRGTVPTMAERDLLLAAALAVPGVIQVTNFLESDEPVGDLGPMQSGIATGI